MRAPDAIRAVLDHILGLCDYTKREGSTSIPETTRNIEAMQSYRRFFAPGEISFEILKYRSAGRSPSPHYHAIEEHKVFLVDRLLSHPTDQQPTCILSCKELCSSTTT
jgi:hypothetical protein